MSADKPTDFLKAHWWNIGALLIAVGGGYFQLTNLKERVHAIELNGVQPVRERLQTVEAQAQFVDHRLVSVETETKQASTQYAEVRSKLDVLGVKIDTISEWVKEQKRKEK